jgi:hypothetical protein
MRDDPKVRRNGLLHRRDARTLGEGAHLIATHDGRGGKPVNVRPELAGLLTRALATLWEENYLLREQLTKRRRRT